MGPDDAVPHATVKLLSGNSLHQANGADTFRVILIDSFLADRGASLTTPREYPPVSRASHCT